MDDMMEETEDSLRLHAYDGNESKDLQEVFIYILEVQG